MNREDIDKIAVSTGIIFLSGLVLFQSCHRASTIYFFELQTTTVIFIEPIPALLLPFALSVLLWLVYKGTKRSASLEVERKAIMDKRNELENFSAANSRKTSRNDISRKISMTDEQQFSRLNRLLSNIQEQDTVQSVQDPNYRNSPEGENKKTIGESDDASLHNPNERKMAGVSPLPSPSDSLADPSSSVTINSRFICTKVEDADLIYSDKDAPCRSISAPATTKWMPRKRSSTESDVFHKTSGLGLIVPAECTLGLSRQSSFGGSIGGRKYAGSDPNEEDSERERNEIYMQLGQTNLFTYSLSALNLLPKNRPGLPELKLNFSDIMSEFFAVHLPVWACVAAFYIILLELFGVHFAYYFYYHEETMVYSAFAFSIMFGLFHEFCGGWVTNDILAFSSIYIACSRIQAVSYQAGLILLVGMAIYDIFWLHVIDLMSTVTRDCRAPFMIMIPRDHRGNKQSLAAMDIIIPGIFLNVIQKYSSMFDPELFTATYAAVFGALTVTMIFSVWRQKITPGLVLPAIMAIVVSMGLCTHRNDLWRFMIKYKRTMPSRRV